MKNRQVSRSYRLLLPLLSAEDRLLVLHLRDEAPEATAATKQLEQRYLADFAQRAAGESVSFETAVKPRGVTLAAAVMGACAEKDPDFICLATQPKSRIGSVADHIVRHYKGNLIITKAP